MKMEMLIDELSEVVDAAFTLPLSGGKTVVNTERIREIIEEMKTNLPQEVRQAKNIAADRNNIINNAKEEAEATIQKAEERAKAMVAQNEIVRQAQQRAGEIISDANQKAAEIKRAANVYIDKIMKKADDELSAELADIKRTRQSFKALQQKENSGNNNNAANNKK